MMLLFKIVWPIQIELVSRVHSLACGLLLRKIFKINSQQQKLQAFTLIQIKVNIVEEKVDSLNAHTQAR